MSINGIEISDVIVFPIKNPQPDSNLKAFAKVILNDQFIISGIRIVEGKNGLFLGFPQDYDKEQKKGYDIAFPITAELRTYFTESVLMQYQGTVNNA